MPQCFVMQPFDGGVFDKRYDEVLDPAIRAAGIEPYRVDRDTAVRIPIEEIEQGIRNADVCLAEITTDNPNVWFELGYAIACGKEVVLVCSAERTTRFPFDVQHRYIIRYRSDSISDFSAYGAEVTTRLQAARERAVRVATVAATSLRETEGLQPHEIATMVIVMTNSLDPDHPPTAHAITEAVGRAGFTDVAAAVALKRLLRIRYLDSVTATSYNGDDYTGFVLTNKGENWLLENQSRLVLRRPGPKHQSPVAVDDDDDALPF